MQNPIGFILIIISSICFGSMAIFARFAYQDGATPMTLLFLRFGIASVCMFFILILKGIRFPRGRTLMGLIVMGAVGYAGQSFCYFTALTLASVGLVALLLCLYPAIVTVLAAMVLKEPLSRAKAVAVGLALAGAALTIGPAGGGQPLGIALSLGAAFIYSLYILLGSRITKRQTPVQCSAVIITAAAVVYGGMVAIQGPMYPRTISGWSSVAAIALLSTVLAIVAFLAGLERVGPTNAATLSNIEPVVTVTLAALLLGEAIKPLFLLGGLLILVAVMILARRGPVLGNKNSGAEADFRVEDRPKEIRINQKRK